MTTIKELGTYAQNSKKKGWTPVTLSWSRESDVMLKLWTMSTQTASIRFMAGFPRP
jgi:hypothetical protein